MISRLHYQTWRRVAAVLIPGILLMGGITLPIEAQEPTAVISSLTEEVLVSIQGTTPTFGISGTVLRTGDVIRTYNEASALLNLSDGSRIEIGEQTNVTLSRLIQEPQTRIRKTSLDLTWGRVRGILSPIYQGQGVTFIVQTPNALISVKSSEADVEVIYEPDTRITTVLAHEFDVRVIHLLTGTPLRLPQGHSAIIRETVMQEIARIVELPPQRNVQGHTATITSLTGDVLVAIHGNDPVPLLMSTVLRTGDILQTNIGAATILEFSHGVTVNLREQSKMSLKTLTEDIDTGQQTSRLELLRGGLRIQVTEKLPASGASFTIETPNVQVAIQASAKVDAEILYDPATSTTTVIAHESDLLITHLLAETTTTIPAGHSGIIHNQVIQEVARIVSEPAETPVPQSEESQQPVEETSTP